MGFVSRAIMIFPRLRRRAPGVRQVFLGVADANRNHVYTARMPLRKKLVLIERSRSRDTLWLAAKPQAPRAIARTPKP